VLAFHANYFYGGQMHNMRQLFLSLANRTELVLLK